MLGEEIPERVRLERGGCVSYKVVGILDFAGTGNIVRRFGFLDNHVTGKALRENLEIFFKFDRESNRIVRFDETRKNKESANGDPAQVCEPFVAEDHRKIDDGSN